MPTARYEALVADGTLTRDSAQESVLPEFDRIAKALKHPAKSNGWFRKSADTAVPKGLYLWGGVGRGKSMLMDLFVDTLEVPNRRVHFHAFMQEMHAGMHVARQRNEVDALAPVARDVAQSVRLLAFDEMQITDITDAMIVGRLFERLFERGVVVVATSNRHPDDLYKDGLNRHLFLPFIEIIKDRLEVHELESPTDHRQARLRGMQVYHTPLGPEATAALDRAWSDLAGAPGTPLVLKHKGRELLIPCHLNGIARDSFDDLCGRPLGPGDYLALAQAIRVLILDNIPHLSRAQNNEAKRFVTLIDTLYEAHIRLICSAAALPQDLYAEGAGAFEFERTASRLEEMQSAEWSAASPA